MLLSNIRVLTIKHSKQLARETRKEENCLYDRANRLEAIIASSRTSQLQAEYDEVKKSLDDIKERRANSAILRSHAKWVEEGEKSNKYFLRLCKSKQVQKNY